MENTALLKAGEKRSALYRVFADGQEIPVFEGHDFHYVHLFTSDILPVEVQVAETVTSVAIRPSRRGKKFRLEEQKISFSVSCGDYLSLEINDDITRPLIIFAEKKMTYDVYDGYTVLRYPAGSYNYVGELVLSSNTVVILEEGAVIEGSISGVGVHNVRILGNGILHYDTKPERLDKPIHIDRSENIEINGITIHGYHTWNLCLRRTRNILIENVKILADAVWSDGIDLVGCEDALVRHIFIKNEDDCLCIKSSGAKGDHFSGNDVRRILFEDCVLWSGPRGNSMEIGYETNNAVIENITFRHIDILHRETQANKFNRAIISIHNAGNAVIRHITYEDIYAESTDENLVMIGHMYQPDWGEGVGRIQNIVIRSLTLAGGTLRPSKILAVAECSNERRVTEDILFENLNILGTPVKSAETALACGFVLDADHIRFR